MFDSRYSYASVILGRSWITNFQKTLSGKCFRQKYLNKKRAFVLGHWVIVMVDGHHSQSKITPSKNTYLSLSFEALLYWTHSDSKILKSKNNPKFLKPWDRELTWVDCWQLFVVKGWPDVGVNVHCTQIHLTPHWHPKRWPRLQEGWASQIIMLTTIICNYNVYTYIPVYNIVNYICIYTHIYI